MNIGLHGRLLADVCSTWFAGIRLSASARSLLACRYCDRSIWHPRRGYGLISGQTFLDGYLLLSSSLISAEVVAEQIRRTGARATPARIRVLQLLRSASTAQTHGEIEAAFGDLALDRVTLYRVLDWLVESGLAHKNTDTNRVFRFSAAAAGEHVTHVHFRCEHCGGVFCLDAAPPEAPVLPAGFTLSRVDFDLRGRCASCSEGKS